MPDSQPNLLPSPSIVCDVSVLVFLFTELYFLGSSFFSAGLSVNIFTTWGWMCVCVCVYVRLWRRLGENPSSGSVSADTHFSFLCFPFEKRERKNFRWARSRRALNWPSRNFCEPTAPHNMRTHNTKFKKNFFPISSVHFSSF